MTLNTEIVDARFHTTVRTTAYCDFEFMRKGNGIPTKIKFIMYFSGDFLHLVVRHAFCEIEKDIGYFV